MALKLPSKELQRFGPEIREIVDRLTDVTNEVNQIQSGVQTISSQTITGDQAVGGNQTIGGTLGVTGVSTFGAPNVYKGATGITAFAGGGQGSATALTAEFNNVSTCATAADSVKLGTPVLGSKMYIKNTGAADLAVFPVTGGTINGGSANASITIPVGTTKEFNATSATNWETIGLSSTALGSAARPSHTFNSQSDQGMYSVSSTQLGWSVGGSLRAGVNANGLFTGAIAEQTTGAGITLSNNIIRQNTAAALNSTGTITASMLNKGLITSTSAAGTTGTLDAIATIATQVGAVRGTVVDFIVDNTAGSNTFTVAVSAGIVAAKQVSSGDTANDVLLTVAASATVGIGVFRLVFSSASAAVLFRIG